MKEEKNKQCSQNSSLIEVGGEHVVFAEPQAESLAQSVTQVMEWSKTKREQWVRDAYKWTARTTESICYVHFTLDKAYW